MYRIRHDNGYDYRCGAYMQGAECDHNHVSGPPMDRFTLSVIRERVLPPERMAKLVDKLTQLAEKESKFKPQENALRAKDLELSQLQRQLAKAGDNLALVDDDTERELIRHSIKRWSARKKELEAEIDVIKSTVTTGFDVKTDMAAAINGLSALTDLADTADTNGALRQLIAVVDAKMFLHFGDSRWGKRTVRELVGGVITVGSQSPPIKIYMGPTGRRSIKDAKKVTAASLAAVTEGSVPSGLLLSQKVPSEEDSLGNLHRGDSTPIELFVRGVSGIGRFFN
jgi:hypothetical protein